MEDTDNINNTIREDTDNIKKYSTTEPTMDNVDLPDNIGQANAIRDHVLDLVYNEAPQVGLALQQQVLNNQEQQEQEERPQVQVPKELIVGSLDMEALYPLVTNIKFEVDPEALGRYEETLFIGVDHLYPRKRQQKESKVSINSKAFIQIRGKGPVK